MTPKIPVTVNYVKSTLCTSSFHDCVLQLPFYPRFEGPHDFFHPTEVVMEVSRSSAEPIDVAAHLKVGHGAAAPPSPAAGGEPQCDRGAPDGA